MLRQVSQQVQHAEQLVLTFGLLPALPIACFQSVGKAFQFMHLSGSLNVNVVAHLADDGA